MNDEQEEDESESEASESSEEDSAGYLERVRARRLGQRRRDMREAAYQRMVRHNIDYNGSEGETESDDSSDFTDEDFFDSGGAGGFLRPDGRRVYDENRMDRDQFDNLVEADARYHSMTQGVWEPPELAREGYADQEDLDGIAGTFRTFADDQNEEFSDSEESLDSQVYAREA